MRAHILFAIPVVMMLSSGCGGSDSSLSPEVVQAPLSLALGTDALAAGASSTGTISLREPAPDDGVVILLASSDVSSVTVPFTLTVGPGEDTAKFVLTNVYNGPPELVRITARSEDATAAESLYVPRLPPEPPVCRTHACTR